MVDQVWLAASSLAFVVIECILIMNLDISRSLENRIVGFGSGSGQHAEFAQIGSWVCVTKFQLYDATAFYTVDLNSSFKHAMVFQTYPALKIPTLVGTDVRLFLWIEDSARKDFRQNLLLSSY